MYQKCIPSRGWLSIGWLLVPVLFSCRSVSYLQGSTGPVIQKENFAGRLPSALSETSGLAYRDGRLWTFNDSGGEAVLYSFLPSDPAGSEKEYPVRGAMNIDWEDISTDSMYFYISDAGNNLGSRDTMRIYQVSVDTAENAAVVRSVISFSYPGKSTAYYDCRRNPFDSEALTVMGDSLWLFTKNWQDESSSIYIYPKQPGFYFTGPRYRLQPGMLVTGADFDQRNSMLWLIGYHHFKPVIRVYRLEKNSLPRSVLRIRLSNRTGLQTEGIVCADDGYVYLSYEKSKRPQGLLRIKNPF